jgi:hypothetical protein
MAQDVYPPVEAQPMAEGGQCIVSPSEPVLYHGARFLWVQTGLGADGTDVTFWIEDGT